MADFTQKTWQVYTSGLPADQRPQAFRDLARGKHNVTDNEGKPLDFSHGPTTATVALPPPVIERKALVPHHRSPASLEQTAAPHDPVQAEKPSGGPGRLSEEDQLSFNAFMTSFQSLAPEEKAASTRKLIEVYSQRLIHD